MLPPADVAPAWRLLTAGIRADMICARDLGEMLTAIRAGKGITLQALDVQVVEGAAELSMPARSCRADKQSLLWCLQALAQSIGAPPFERTATPYRRAVTERVEETTVGDLRGAKVGAANAFVADYCLPDGRSIRGPTIALHLFDGDEKHRVGVGSQLTVGAITWTVRALEVGGISNGWVELQAEVPADRAPAPRQTLDFCFESRCQRCGGRTGWDGGVDHSTGRPVVSTRCIRCPEIELLTGGAVEAAWEAATPRLTVGRERR